MALFFFAAALAWLAVILLAYPLGHSIVTRGFGTTWTINAYNAVQAAHSRSVTEAAIRW